MRYIDLDALGVGKCNPNVFNESQYADGWNSLIKIIFSAPLEDVEKIRRGNWTHNSDRQDALICSVCNCGFDMWKHEQDEFHYCPACGAKMDLEVEE